MTVFGGFGFDNEMQKDLRRRQEERACNVAADLPPADDLADVDVVAERRRRRMEWD